jgi:hypothetical protein
MDTDQTVHAIEHRSETPTKCLPSTLDHLLTAAQLWMNATAPE